jgi:hypothetical protein
MEMILLLNYHFKKGFVKGSSSSVLLTFSQSYVKT